MHDHSKCVAALDAAKKALQAGNHAEGRAHVGRAMAALKAAKPSESQTKLASRLKSFRKQ